MIIGLFTDPYYPIIDGVANSVEMLKDQLEQRGHEVHVFTTTNPLLDRKEINVHRSPSMPFFLLPSRRAGIPYNPRAVYRVKKMKLDIVHTHTEFSMGMFGLAIARLLKKPIVHTYHTIYEDYSHYLSRGNKYFDRPSKKVARAISRNFCNSCEQIIVPTAKTRDLLQKYGIKKPIEIIPTGLVVDRFRPEHCDQTEIARLRAEYGIGPDDKIILFVGRIAKEKQIECIMERLPPYMSDRSEVKFLLVGGGPWRSALEKKAREGGIGARVIFAGEHPYRTIANFYQLGDVFINASQSETQGLTYIEAMAAGIPVVARADRCLEGFLTHGESGLTFNDPEEIPALLDKALFDPCVRAHIIENANRVVMENAAEMFAARVEKVYERVLARRRLPRPRRGGGQSAGQDAGQDAGQEPQNLESGETLESRENRDSLLQLLQLTKKTLNKVR